MNCLPGTSLPAVALWTALALPAQDNVSGAPLPQEQACYDVAHYELRLTVDPDQREILGWLTMTATAVQPTGRVALDLDPALEAFDASVAMGDGPFADAPLDRQGGRLFVDLPEEAAAGSKFRVVIAYGGQPRTAPNPPWKGGFTWAKTKDGGHWIATSCQGEGADLWWPCKDHPSDKPDGVDLIITVPEGLIVASNGLLLGEPEVEDGKATFHWRTEQPISNYCVALNIAPYVIIEDEFSCVDGTEMPVVFYALPENADKARKVLPQFLDHVKVFEEILGPYPFRSEKYGIAETPHLGMEHQTIIAYGNKYRDLRYDWLHNHELSHEWWGNLVTCRNWKDMWIHEGFGTYMQPLYLERTRGRRAYEVELQRRLRQIRNEAPIAPREPKDSAGIYFDGRGGNDIYYKGAWVLHTLRWLLGDEAFFTCLRRFCYPTAAAAAATDGSQVRLVDTEDFIALVNEVTGEDYGWFFEVYVRQPALPRLVLEVQDGVLQLLWVVPGGLPFTAPVPVQIGEEVVRVEMPGGKGVVDVGDGDFVIDPRQWLLRQRPVR